PLVALATSDRSEHDHLDRGLNVRRHTTLELVEICENRAGHGTESSTGHALALPAQNALQRTNRAPVAPARPRVLSRARGRASSPMTAALHLDGVAKIFGGLRAVDGVSLTVEPGERRALIGPNGAGKTTLFNLIAGALPVTTGRIELFGRDVTRMPSHRRAALGLTRTFQISNLFASLTVLDNCLLAVQAPTTAKFAMHRPLARDLALRARAEDTLAA